MRHRPLPPPQQRGEPLLLAVLLLGLVGVVSYLTNLLLLSAQN